eukprot:TRINITY_DN5125_c0_g1_i2.p1 TRINITY_DN5125_c0_g1~~TRINITY_DN5125_c0_g1_i2.p1  ORF type:complete len:101 (+),score=5.28 TRINITY_DN5125_c0_g1_i2:28-303(+)
MKLAVLLLAFCFSFASASLLIKDKHNPCRAYGNATTYDITDLFDWPITVSHPGGYNQTYTYWWSCNGNLTVAPSCNPATTSNVNIAPIKVN